MLIFVCRTRRARTEVLVVRRCRQLGGYWHAVAGGVEEGETDEDAALRELLEETGLDERNALDGSRHTFSYQLARNERVAVTCFRVDVPRGWEPRLDWEHDEYRWCDPPEATALLRWPRVRRALAALVDTSPVSRAATGW